jgi:hypothetical protein
MCIIIEFERNFIPLHIHILIYMKSVMHEYLPLPRQKLLRTYLLRSKIAHEVPKPLAAPPAEDGPSRQIYRLSARPPVCVLSHLMQ